MTTHSHGASSRRWLASLAAICTLASLAVAPAALADEPASNSEAPAVQAGETSACKPIQGTDASDSPKVTDSEQAEGSKGAAAQIGEEKTCDTLEAAISEAENGATVKLLKDVQENVTVPAGKTIILDLNSHTLSGGTVASKAALTNNGTVTVKDSVGGGKIIREDKGSSGYYTIDNQGTMTIESGSVYNQTGPMPAGSSLIRNAGGNKEAMLNITGGDIRQDGFIAVKNDDHGILNVTGGTISVSGDTTTNTASAVQNWSQATISGGSINGAVWASTWSEDLPASKTVITGNAMVSGKIIVKQQESENGGPGDKVPQLSITGGTLHITGWSVGEKNVAISISGGKFSGVQPSEDYLAPGFVVNGNGTVTVPTPAPSEPTITGIEIAAKPSKTEYKIGEAFDATGLKVNMKWSSGKRDALKPAQYEVTGFDSSKPGKVTVTLKLAWDESKTASFEVTVKASDVQVRRLYNKASGEHFYTTSEQEVKAVLKSSKDWRDEGDAFTMSDWGRQVWRFYHPGSGKHMYTASEAERDALAASGWRAEGVAFREPEGADTKVYRLYNTGNGDHLFTSSWLEYTALRILPWWRGEGVGFNAR